MEIKHIREFVALAHICSYSKAAKSLFISQSSLFKHIKALEDEIGTPLFDKIGKRISLSGAGHRFLDYSEKLLDLTDKFNNEMSNYLDTTESSIFIGSQYRVSELIVDFRNKHRRYALRLIEGGTLEDFFMRNGCELAFMRDFSDTSGKYDSVLFALDKRVVILPLDHHLAGKSPLTTEDLMGEDFIAVTNSASNTANEKIPGVLTLAQLLGFVPRIVMTAPVGSEAMKLVTFGAGIALISKNTIGRDFASKLWIADIDAPTEFTVSLVWRKDAKLSEGAQLFIDFAKAWSEQNITTIDN